MFVLRRPDLGPFDCQLSRELASCLDREEIPQRTTIGLGVVLRRETDLILNSL